MVRAHNYYYRGGRYIESAGGRVVPVHYDAPLSNLTTTFEMINGLLFPGGGMDLSDFDSRYANCNNASCLAFPTSFRLNLIPKLVKVAHRTKVPCFRAYPFLKWTRYMKAVLHLWNLAIASNDAGNFFPVWGTCLGFETITVVAANTPDVLVGGFDSEKLPLPLMLTAAASQSRLLGSAPAAVLAALSTKNVTMNNHRSGSTPATYSSNKRLSDFYNVLSTNIDRNGAPFVRGHAVVLLGAVCYSYVTLWIGLTKAQMLIHNLIALCACVGLDS